MPADAFQLTEAAARKYQDHSVPAMFGPLADATIDRLSLPESGHILDVACGTGALTRAIANKMAGHGRIVGTDLNQTMIDVAQTLTPDTPHELEWVAADVTALPFENGTFDLACLQQGLQFFPDKPAALAEIHRVLKPDGRLCLTCWRAISPFNNALAKALKRYVNAETAEKARAPFSFRDGDLISRLLTAAGFSTEEHSGIVIERRFDDLRAQILALPVEHDMRAAGEPVIDQVLIDVAHRLQPYDREGVFVVPQEAHFFTARRT